MENGRVVVWLSSNSNEKAVFVWYKFDFILHIGSADQRTIKQTKMLVFLSIIIRLIKYKYLHKYNF